MRSNLAGGLRVGGEPMEADSAARWARAMRWLRRVNDRLIGVEKPPPETPKPSKPDAPPAKLEITGKVELSVTSDAKGTADG